MADFSVHPSSGTWHLAGFRALPEFSQRSSLSPSHSSRSAMQVGSVFGSRSQFWGPDAFLPMVSQPYISLNTVLPCWAPEMTSRNRICPTRTGQRDIGNSDDENVRKMATVRMPAEKRTGKHVLTSTCSPSAKDIACCASELMSKAENWSNLHGATQ